MKNEDNRQMALGVLAYATGQHVASWLQSSAPPDATTNLRYWRRLAKLAEEGMFDLLFLADSPGARTEKLNDFSRFPYMMNMFEPLTLLSALAGSTTNIGLGATGSTSFYEPYNLARLYASLDHLSEGRAAWNVVTTASDYAARNFGFDKLPSHADRYARAREFFEVVMRLWDTWDDDAFLADKAACRMFDPEKFHVTDYRGEHVRVHGALNIRRTPQGRPVIIQAGSSEAGKMFAAESAEVVFASDPTFEEAQRFYADVKGRMSQFNRDTSQLKILPGLSVMVGSSKAEAEDKYRALQDLIHPDVGRMRIGMDLETDLSGVPVDEMIPEHLIPKKANLTQSYFTQITSLIREKKLTLRELYTTYDRGKVTICGTPEQIVDHMEAWVDGGAADGFMLAFHVIPNDLEDFVRQVVPEMQRRGRLRKHYTGSTLRDNLRLQYPTSRHAH